MTQNTRLLSCKPPLHRCTRNLPPSSTFCKRVAFPHRRLESPYPCSSHCSQLVDPLELSLVDLQYHDHVKWDGSLTTVIRHSPQQKIPLTRTSLSSSLVPLTTFVSVSQLGLGATLYVNSLDRLLPPGFYSFASIRSHGYRVRSKPCLSQLP